MPLILAGASFAFLVVALIAVAYGAFTYSNLMRSALLADRLQEENSRLQRDVEKIPELEQSLVTNRLLLQKMMELIGVDLDPALAMSDSLAVQFSSEDARYSSETLGSRSFEGVYNYDSADEYTPRGIPMHGSLSQGFAPDESKGLRRHLGIDIAGREGTPVRATAAGTVEFAGWDEVFGNYIVLDHTFGYKTHYGHNRAILVSVGDKIKRGELIALSGNTGRSSAPHLHYEVRFEGEPVDPVGYLDVESLRQVN